MATKLSEIEALKVIDEALENLTTEEKQRIFSFISSKHSITIAKGGGENTNNENNGGNVNLNNSDIKQFLSSKKPIGFYEQIACLGYHLEKIQGLESFDTKSITKANTAARATKIPNPSLYLGDVVSKYGYLAAIGGGKKAMTARGEALVEALPDRAAVKVALDNNPIKKKTSSKKKKTKN